ncbi:hypothetical protein [Flagellimonas algicola]|uniref:Uncharacterized protein n=1 Tax=Flagellimonas algicola TaxID=2583815 RepID=A0ABY2WSD5_9FLAO|nr:hypothetical protein [Allomuricauda algicola]TMU57582.1 hypothetical protein FGG15_08560 [Allomuricauda algicola]
MRAIFFFFFVFSFGSLLLAQQRANVQPGVISVYQKGLQGIGPDFGNNPASENFYSQMRDKFAALGIEQQLNLSDIEGSIYSNDVFESGAILFKGEEDRKMFMRYNAFNDEFEIKNSNLKEDKTLALLKNQNISCVLNGQLYSYMILLDKKGERDQAYLKEIVSLGNYRLFEQNKKLFKEGKPAKTSHAVSFPHRFVDETNYYLALDDAFPVYIPVKKKDFVALFSEEHQPQVKKFIKEKGIDLKTKRGLVNAVTFAGNL